jgi:uncharacterized protein YjcR
MQVNRKFIDQRPKQVVKLLKKKSLSVALNRVKGVIMAQMNIHSSASAEKKFHFDLLSKCLNSRAEALELLGRMAKDIHLGVYTEGKYKALHITIMAESLAYCALDAKEKKGQFFF